MQKVWLSTTYYHDPAVEQLSGNAERMLTRALAHCGNAETGGYISAAAIKKIGLPNPAKLAAELVAQRIWLKRPDGWEFRSWSSWNGAGDAIVDRRRADRERQQRKRQRDRESREESRDNTSEDAEKESNPTDLLPSRSAKNSDSTDVGNAHREGGSEARKRPHQPVHDSWSRSSSRDVTTPDKNREEENRSSLRDKSSHESDASENEPRGPKVDPNGWRLVRELIPLDHPQAVRAELANRAGALLLGGTPETDVRKALSLWLTKPNLGPRTLDSLVSEIVKTRDHQPKRASGNGQAHKLRALAELAAAEETAELAAAERPKELR